MKKILFAITLAALAFSSCALTENDIVLENGVVIDRSTQDRLKLLEREFLTLSSEQNIQSRQAELSEIETIVHEPIEITIARELLVREFGQEGSRYIIEGRNSKAIAESDDPLTPSSRAWHSKAWHQPIGMDSQSVFYMVCDSKWYTTPWASYVYAITHTIRVNRVASSYEENINILGSGFKFRPNSTQRDIQSQQIFAAIKHTTAPWQTITRHNISMVMVTSSPATGVFPPPPANVETLHRASHPAFINGDTGTIKMVK
jgi:hypothetical protein